MKSLSLLLPCAALLSHATAQTAYMYAIEQSGLLPPDMVGMDSHLASLIISRRRGIQESRYLGTTDEEAILQVAALGGHQKPLFEVREPQDRLVIVYRDVDADFLSRTASTPNVRIVRPDTNLISDVPTSSRRNGQACEFPLPAIEGATAGQIEWFYVADVDKNNQCPHVPAHSKDLVNVQSALTELASRSSSKVELFTALQSLLREHSIESTVLVVPPQLATPLSRHQWSARDETTEEDLLKGASGTDPKYAPAAHYGSMASNYTLPKKLPTCYKSQSACENTTNSCSGHGNCYRAHSDCFKCRCGTTIARYNKDGSKKTVQWGGAACQKKDVSAPFILFASFGVVMTALVAGAIGMLYSMGSQELPSVIGAGVAGPRAQK